MIKRLYFRTLQKIIQLKLKVQKSFGKILLFHQVDNKKENWDDNNFSITRDSFFQLIVKLQKKGVRFCKIDDLFQSPSKNNMFLTFDDGYRELYLEIAPFLIKLEIPFCIFITTSFIDLPNYLTAKMIQELSKEDLCTIGSHTISHRMLRNIEDCESAIEIALSKQLLEKMINKKVNFFAYPYGSLYACSKKNIICVSNSGYVAAFSTINSSLSKKELSRKFFIPRVNVNEKNHQKIR